MSNDTQNTNESDFRPSFGTDNHGIQYSCGHINPLQKVMKNNCIQALDSIKSNFESAISSIDTIKEEILCFAKKRCEDIRSINIELRNLTKEGCDCECECVPDYDNCPYCEDYRYDRDFFESEKYELEEKVVELQDEATELQESLLEANAKIQELFHSLNDIEKN
jgi:hypothetical protein